MTSAMNLVLLVVVFFVSTTMLVVSLLATNPLAIGPLGATLWFLVVALALTSGTALVLYIVKSYLRLHRTRQQRLRYSWRQGLLVGGWGAGLLALSSLNQLGVRDAILLALLLAIVEVYVRFRWP